jgi:hypothetical protein
LTSETAETPEAAPVETIEERVRIWKDRSPLPGMVWPGYADGCITHISRIVRNALGKPSPVPPRLTDFAAPADRVALIIADGLGYHGLARFRTESAVVDRLAGAARLEVLTSVFPSTTPAALTSLYTGAAPREHGLMGGNVFLRELGGPASALRFSPLEDPRRDVFLESGLDLKAFCPVPSVFERIGRRNAGSAWVPRAILDNSLCRIGTAGAAYKYPFFTPAQAIAGARRSIEADGPRFQCIYWDATDSISHVRGPYSEELRAEVNAFFRLLEDELLSAKPGNGKTRVLLTADHGHATVRKTGIHKLANYPKIQENLLAPPLGGTRVPYLYALPGREEALREACRPLEDRYFVLDAAEMLELGLWGEGAEHPEAANRIGTLILVPRGDETFHFKDPLFFSSPERGDHDGLSAEEMTVPLLMWEIG